MKINVTKTADQYRELGEKQTALIERANNRDEPGMTADELVEFKNMDEKRDALKATLDAAAKLDAGDRFLDDIGLGDGDEDRSADGGGGRLSSPDGLEDRGSEPEGVELRMYDVRTREVRNETIRTDDPRYALAARDYNDAFRSYMRDGIVEDRSLKIAEGEKGGYVAPIQTASRFIQYLADINQIRGISDNVAVNNAAGLGVRCLLESPASAVWASEESSTDISDDSAMKFGKRELSPHLMIGRVDASKTMVSRLPEAEGWINDQMGYQAGRKEEEAFIEGDGTGKPLGVFTASDSGIPTSRDVNLGSTTDLTDTGLIEMQYGLKAQYRRRATWVMSRVAAKRTRLLQDGNGVFIWRPGLTMGEPDTLLGNRIAEAELAPGHDEATDFASGKYAIVFGDFSFYMIATALNLSILRDVYTRAGQNMNKYFSYHEVDGMPVLAEAFVRGKLSV